MAAPTTAHNASAKWATTATIATARGFWAECACGWYGPMVKRLATAENHVQKHLRENTR